MLKIKKELFGVLSSGEKVYLFVLQAGDIKLCISEYGAAWTSLFLPDLCGNIDDIILGYSTLQAYTQKNPFFGATIGRYANRIGGSSFVIDGIKYKVTNNEGNNCLHSGLHGFDKKLWRGIAYKNGDAVCAQFTYESPDGEEGFPGVLNAAVTYSVTQSNQIIADYKASVSKKSPINLTNHAYYNLSGQGRGTILDHKIKLYASRYVPVDSSQIPCGNLQNVKDTQFDFTEQKEISFFKNWGANYDHCLVVDGEIGTLRPAAEVLDTLSGRFMKVSTTQPGLQFFTSGGMPEISGKDGSVYGRHSGFCLETQNFPDAPNKENFPNSIFGDGKDYSEKSVFSFGLSRLCKC
ncbi:MAG: galactose mutarotase [Termitinemataceae bacterium]|nr:MAG: galactose mutarotase [Termitinemataceae bacterium]